MLTFLMLAALGAQVEKPTQDALREAETRWSRAFVSGDASTLQALLTPDYVSVSARGVPRGRDEIINLAQRYAADHPGAQPAPASPAMVVQIAGDTGLVRHSSASELSVDVFRFEAGHWRAWYSQHTSVAAAP